MDRPLNRVGTLAPNFTNVVPMLVRTRPARAGRAVWAVWVMRVLGLVACVLACVLAGCVDARAVRTFALQSAAVAQTGDVADLGPESVERSIELTADAAQAETLRSALSEAHRNAERTIALQKVVQAYMRALARLADDELIAFDAELLALTDAAAGVGIARDETVAASTRSVLNLLARAATDAYRRGKLAEVIVAADTPLSEILDALIQLAERGVIGLLEDESAKAESAFGVRAAEARSALPGPGAEAVARLVEDADRAHRRAQADRAALVRAYVAALREIKNAHAMLANDASASNGKELAAWLRPYLERIESLRAQIAEARLRAAR